MVGSGLRLAWSASLLAMSDLRLGIAWFTFGLAWLTVGWGRFTVWHGQVYRWPGLNKPHEHGLIIRTLIMTPHPSSGPAALPPEIEAVGLYVKPNYSEEAAKLLSS